MNAEDFLAEILDSFWTVVDSFDLPGMYGLKGVFKRYDGRVLPILRNGMPDAMSIPALYCESIQPVVDVQDSTPYTEQVGFDLDLAFVFPNAEAHNPHTSVVATAAMMLLKSRLMNRETITGGLHANIDEFSVELGDLEPVRSEENPGRILFWDGHVIVRLRRVWDLS